MMGPRLPALLLAAVLLFSPLAQSAQVLLVDSKDASYLRPSDGLAAPSLDQQGLSALLSALAGLLPPSSTGPELSRTIDSILKPSPLVKPRACVALNVAGLTAADVSSLFSGRQQRVVDIELPVGSSAASIVVSAVTAVALANPGADLLPLEPLALLKGCGALCLQQHLNALVQAVDTELVALDIQQSGSERLFAMELANALAGARVHVQDIEVASQGGVVLEVTLLGLHQLSATHGADAPQVEVAKAVVLNVVALLAAALDAAYQGDVAYQVALLDSIPEATASMQELLSWKEHSRKQLMQVRGLQTTTDVWPAPNEAALAKTFTIKAAAFGSFILLLYFALAAVHCMCNMPFKADSMLFGRTKAD